MIPNMPGRDRVGVDVNLRDLDLTVVLGRELLDDRRDHLAGRAPRCPEVHQHGDVRVEHLFLEGGVGDGDGMGHWGLLMVEGALIYRTQPAVSVEAAFLVVVEVSDDVMEVGVGLRDVRLGGRARRSSELFAGRLARRAGVAALGGDRRGFGAATVGLVEARALENDARREEHPVRRGAARSGTVRRARRASSARPRTRSSTSGSGIRTWASNGSLVAGERFNSTRRRPRAKQRAGVTRRCDQTSKSTSPVGTFG